MYRALIRLMTFQFTIIQILFKSKNDLVLETIELRQQLATYQAKNEDLKSITDLIRSFLVSLKRAWPKWMDALIIVKPETDMVDTCQEKIISPASFFFCQIQEDLTPFKILLPGTVSSINDG